MIRLLMTIGFALVTTQASAQVAVPKSYVDGEVIHADELNTNLEAIAGAVPPRTCTTDQIIKWDGSAWACADLPSAGNVVEDGVVYGSPVWVDSSGTVLTGRAGHEILWRVNGELKTIGRVQNGAYAIYVARYYTSFDCTGEAIGFRQQYGQLWVANGVLNEEGALVENAPQFNSIDYQPGGSCSVETGESTNVRRESSIGVAAPSWTTDGTQMFSDLR